MLGTASLNAFIPTRDPVAARAFYEGTLGLRFVADGGFALIFDANGTTLRVTPVETFTPHEFTVLGWQVEDIALAAAELAGRGVNFERFPNMGIEQDDLGVWHAPGGDKVAWFRGPDGNLLSVSSEGGH